ncbi:hypothetical protein MUP46_03210 [Patescibacteria group bacterium]|nr:hypothetical protein [Patescibacteria group bacterium]
MRYFSTISIFFIALVASVVISTGIIFAAFPTPSPTATPTSEPTAAPFNQVPTLGPLETILKGQNLGPVWPVNPIKYAIRGAVAAGVPANTLALLLLLPLVAMVIAAIRHLVGLRGFGIFLPAALSVVFLAIGPILGIGLFLVIVLVSTIVRIIMRTLKLKLQYLPKMALIFWFVSFAVLGVLFAAPLISWFALPNVSIFAVLFLTLLAEDFTRVQLGKSFHTAISLTTETLILALISFAVLTLKPVQEFAILKPEIYLLSIFIFDFLLGRYAGLRVMELWRFRKLTSQ